MNQHDAGANGLVLETIDAMFVSDHALKIVLWNKGAEALLGYEAKEVIGTPCHELIGCRTRSGRLLCHGNCMTLLKNREPKLAPSIDHVLRKKDGRDLWANITTIFAPGQRGGLPMLVHLLRDSTRQRTLEQLFRQLRSDPKTGSGVFRVGQYQVRLQLIPQNRQRFLYDAPAGLPENVTNEQNPHECLALYLLDSG